MKLRNVAIAALSVLTLFGGGAAVYGTSQVRAAQQQFVYSGYLLDGSETKENGYAKYTFEAGTTYKTGYPDSVIFKDTAGVQVATSRNAFLHYADGSLSALTDGVIVDLNNMSNGMLNNFGINAGTILERRDSSYVVDSISGTLYLDDFLWKINDSQYILVSSTIDITTGAQEPIYYNDYVEMRYYNEGILMLITENGAYRTVASDCVATVNSGIQLDLSARTVTTDEEGTKMSMEQIVLDSNQVIDVLKPIMSAQKSDDLFSERQINEAIKIALPTFEVIDGEDGESGEAGEDGEDGEAGEDGQKGLTGADGLTGKTGENGKTGIDGIAGPDGAGGAPGAPGEPGVAGTSGTNGKNGQNGMSGPSGASGAKGQDGLGGDEQIINGGLVEEQEQLVLPEFSFETFKVTENAVNATLKIDKPDILTGEVCVDLVRAADGQLVKEHERFEPGVGEAQISFNELLPDTTYLIRVTATYSAADATGATHDYQNVFLTKQFTTNATGIYVEPVVKEENALTFRVIKPEYSQVSSYTLVIRKADTTAQDGTITGEEIGEGVYKFTGLSTNTPYYADVTGITLSEGTMPDIKGEQQYYTLKKKPILSQPDVFVNKVDSVFEMSLPQVVDPDNGIRYYRYEVYETTINADNLRKTYQISTNRSVACQVDGVDIRRNYPYVLRVVAGFYDNEKTIEYSVDSTQFSLDGAEWPIIRFNQTEVLEHDVLKGEIRISMNDAELDTTQPIRVLYRSSTGKTKEWTTTVTSSMQVEGSSTYVITDASFELDELCASDTYVCDVYGTFSLADGNEGGKYWRENEWMGSFMAKTKPVGTVAISVSRNESDTSHHMSFRLNMKPVNDGENAQMNPYAYASASGLQLEILDNAGNSVYSHTYESEEAYNPDSQTGGLSQEFGGEQSITFTENDMPGVMSLLSGDSYKVKLTRLYDHTEEENAINVKGVQGNGTIMESEPESSSVVWRIEKNEKLPSEEDIVKNPLTVIPITNAKAASIDNTYYNGALPQDAIVGYELIPNYSKLIGQEKEFIFYAFRCSDLPQQQLQKLDATAGEFYLTNTGSGANNAVCLATRTEVVDQSSYAVPSVRIWFADTEGKMTRGQKYAFSFEVKLQEEDTYFPSRDSNYIFLSAKDEATAAAAPYVKPELMQFVHWSSGTGGELVYKYKIKAVDTDAVSANFSGAVSDTIKREGTIGTITITGLQDGRKVLVNCSSQKYSNLYEKKEKTDHAVIDHIYESIKSAGELKASYQQEDDLGRLKVSITGSAQDINRIPAFLLTVTPETGGLSSRELKLPISSISTSGDTAVITAYVDYSLLDGYINNDITLSLVAKYDNGTAGYGAVSGEVAIQALQAGRYVKLNANGEYQCNNDTSASDSWFKINGLDGDWIGSYSVIHELTDKSASLTLNPTIGGTRLEVVDSTVTVKQLVEQAVTSTGNTIMIGNLTPAVTVTDNSGANTIETAGAWARVNFTLSGYSSLLGDDNKMTLYMEVYKVNASGDIGDKLTDADLSVQIETDDSTAPVKSSIEIKDGLMTDSTYAVRFYYMELGNKKHPLDTARPGTAGESCYFKFRTKGNITLSNARVKYVADDYDSKFIKIEVDINDNRGYDIIYELKDGNNITYGGEVLRYNGKEIVSKTPTNFIQGTQHTITLNAVFGIDWFGRDDLILIATPVSKDDNAVKLGEPFPITIAVQEPPSTNFDVLPIPSKDKLTVRIRAIDPGRLIYGDTYTIKVLDEAGNDVTPSTISATYNSLQTESIAITTVKIDGTDTALTDASLEGKKWRVEINAVLDKNHDGEGETPYTSTTEPTALSTTNAFFGEVELVSVGEKLALYFMNSVELTTAADTVRYTVLSNDTGNYKTYTVNDFGIRLEETSKNSGIYRLMLNGEVAQTAGTYRIEFEFFKSSESVLKLVFNYIKVNPSVN